MPRALSFPTNRPAIFFLLTAMIASAGYFALGPYSFLPWYDFGDSHVTRYVALTESVPRHGIHYWWPLSASGLDMLSNGFRPFDVFFLLFSVLPAWAVAAVTRVAQYFLAGYFAYRLLRSHLDLPPWAAIAGGVAVLCAQSHLMEHLFGYGLVPLLIYALDDLVRRPRLAAFAGAALAGAVWSLTSFVHLTGIFAFPTIAAWILFRHWRAWPRVLLLLVVFGAALILFQANMLAAMALNGGFSHRVDREIVFYPLRLALTVFGNPLSLALVGGLLAGGRDRRWGLFLGGLIVAAIALVAAQAFVRDWLAAAIPLLGAFNMARIAETIPLHLAIGGAWGLARLAEWADARPAWSDGRRDRFAAAILAGYLIAALLPVGRHLLHDARDWVLWGGYTANYRAPALQRLAREAQASPEPFRVATVQENGLVAGYANAYGLESADGYFNMYPKRYQRLWGSTVEPYHRRNEEERDYFFNRVGNRMRLMIDVDGHLPVVAADNFRVPLLSLLNVRYLISNVPLAGEGLTLLPETKPDAYWDSLSASTKIRRRLAENFTGRHVMIYRIEETLPRWYLAADVRLHESPSSLAEDLRSATTADLRKTVRLLRDDVGALGETGGLTGAGTVTHRTYAPDRVALEVDAPGPTVLVVTNTLSPFWRAAIDGRPAPILPAYGALWAVRVPAGRHTVEFEYRPPYAAPFGPQSR